MDSSLLSLHMVSTMLARRGNLHEAEILLEQPENADTCVENLHLSARIAAQLANFNKAEALWKRILGIQPDHKEAQAGLNRIRVLRRSLLRRSLYCLRRQSLMSSSIFVLILLVVFLGASSSAFYRGRIKDVARMTGDGSREIIHDTNLLKNAVPPPQKGLPAAWLRSFSCRGVSVDTLSGNFRLTFLEGLFISGSSRLVPSARETIVELGQKIKPISHDALVVIRGSTDDAPLNPASTFRSNSELAIARSVSVSNLLVTTVGLREDRICVSVAESPPFPNDTEKHRSMNRSVIINLHVGQ